MAASPPASARSRTSGSDASESSWEDRLLGGVDRVLQSTMGTPPPEDDKKPGRSRRPDKKKGKGFSPNSWKRASAIEGIGVALILLFVVFNRPDSQAAAPTGPDGYSAVASGATADGAVVLSTGQRVQLLGISFPTDLDPPVVRSAAHEMLDRLVRGRRVYVEFDPVLPGSVQRGQGSTVAYVWVLDQEGRRKAMANSALLARGLARPVTSIGFQRQSAFLQATAAAQGREAGVWRPQEPELGGLIAPF